MKYKDLKLKDLREKCDLDFAHFTYGRKQCSCCYTPKDMSKKYWKNNAIPETGDYTYILFKNAYNGGGTVELDDDIKKIQFINWSMPLNKLHAVCVELKKQFGDKYTVLEPLSEWNTIIICHKDYEDKDKYIKDKKRYKVI